MAKIIVQLEAAEFLDPVQQGNLDGLCGLYCVINAIRLALFPDIVLGPAYCRHLFAEGMRFLRQFRRLHSIVAEGMGEKTWARLTRHLVGIASNDIGIALKRRPLCAAKRPMDRTKVIEAIEEQLGNGVPVLAGLSGGMSHYTVMVGITERRILLFDSNRRQFMSKRRFDTIDDTRPRTNWVGRNSLATLVRT